MDDPVQQQRYRIVEGVLVLPDEIAAEPGSEADRRPGALCQLPADLHEHRHEVMLHVIAEEEPGLRQVRDDAARDSQKDGELP